MTNYRLYFMNGFSGHIVRFEQFDAPDDAAAGELAAARQGPLALELWCDHRKVVRIDATGLGAHLLARRAELKAVKAQVEPAADDGDETNAENRSA